MKRLFIGAFVLIALLISVYEDRAKMQHPLRQDTDFSEEDALHRTIEEIGLPNLEINTQVERNVKFCGKEPFIVEFGNKVQLVNSGHYLVRISDRWRTVNDNQEKLNRIRFYYVSRNSFQLQYQDGSIVATIGDCSSGDEYGIRSFQPVTAGVFISNKDLEQIINLSEEKEAVLGFIRAWAAKNRDEIMKWMEPNAGMKAMIEQLMDNRYSYAFSGMQGPLAQSDWGEVCMGVSYRVSDSVEKEERELLSAVCVRPNNQGKWRVYMID